MINISVQWDARHFRGGCDAVRETFERTGVGISYYRPRRAYPDETAKPPKAWMILNKIKKQTGHNPLDPPEDVQREIQSMLNTECEDLIVRAFETSRSQRSEVKRLVVGAAKDLREDAQERIRTDRTRFRSGSLAYLRYKAKNYNYRFEHRAPQFRHMTRRFGRVLPLVVTGRLYDCMAERWYERAPRGS